MCANTRVRITEIALALALPALVAAGCDQGGGGSTNTYTITGITQKGPFINGSTVTIQELDEALNPTGETFTAETLNDLGAFEIGSSLATPFAEVIIEGFFFDEVSGTLSAAPITLRTMADLTDGTAVNVNILTHLERQRIASMFESSGDFAAARTQAEQEVLAAFGIDGSGFSSFHELDITKAGDGNAALLAISAILQQMALSADAANAEAELSAILSAMVTDLEADGTLDSSSMKDRIVDASMQLDLLAVRNNLEARMDELGITGSAPAFEDYVDSDGDSVLNMNDDDVPEAFSFDDVVDAYVSTSYLSNEVLVSGLADVGFTRTSVENGTLMKNGFVVQNGTTVANGDTIAVEVGSSDQYDTATTATLLLGNVSTTFTVTTGSEQDYGDSDGDGIVNIEDDDLPDSFSFVDVADADRTEAYVSNEVEISGLNDEGTTLLQMTDDHDNASTEQWSQPQAILRKNGEEVSGTSTVANGDKLELEIVAPYTYDTGVTATVTVGEAVETWSVTSRAYGAMVAEGTLEEPWEILGAYQLGEFPCSVDNTNSYYRVQVPSGLNLYLRNLNDDVDLYVYAESDFATNLLCESTLTGTDDESCEGVGNEEDLFVRVDGSKTTSGALFDITTEP